MKPLLHVSHKSSTNHRDACHGQDRLLSGFAHAASFECILLVGDGSAHSRLHDNLLLPGQKEPAIAGVEEMAVSPSNAPTPDEVDDNVCGHHDGPRSRLDRSFVLDDSRMLEAPDVRQNGSRALRPGRPWHL